MRYYDIQISDSSGKMVREYTSFTNGVSDPNALDMLIDAPISSGHEPPGDVGAMVRLWGIPLTDISQSANLNKMNIKVYGGMQKGLPLANPTQAGLLVQGQIFQAFGNWIGNNMTLDLQIMPGLGTAAAPANVVLNWPKGQTMADAITQSLKQAFPAFTPTVNISPALLFTEAQTGIYQTFSQFATWANQFSKSIIGGNYMGVHMAVNGTKISVYDNTTQMAATTIAFNDLIGQVTWIAPRTISVTCVMRAQPNVGDYITLPPGQITINQASLSQFRQGSVFQGTFMISTVHHAGHFRQPLSEDWVTVFTAVQVLPSTSGTGS